LSGHPEDSSRSNVLPGRPEFGSAPHTTIAQVEGPDSIATCDPSPTGPPTPTAAPPTPSASSSSPSPTPPALPSPGRSLGGLSSKNLSFRVAHPIRFTTSSLGGDSGYAYRPLNRLVTARLTDTQNWSAASQQTTWYQYDDLGNRISSDDRGAGAIAYGHDKANRMTNVAGLTQRYDKAGNVTVAYSANRGTSYRYYYDHHNRLTTIHRITGGSEPSWTGTTVASFKWDALGRRVEYVDWVRGKYFRYFYDGVSELSREDTFDNLYQFYVHGLSYIDEHIMLWRYRIESNGGGASRPYYYVLDRMYNVRAIMDRLGAIVERYAYDPYGLPLIRESAGRGDMNNDSVIDTGAEQTRFNASLYPGPTVIDARADVNDDGNRDSGDRTPRPPRRQFVDGNAGQPPDFEHDNRK